MWPLIFMENGMTVVAKTLGSLASWELSVRVSTLIALVVGAVGGFSLGVLQLGGGFGVFTADASVGSEHCLNGYLYRFEQREGEKRPTLELVVEGRAPDGEVSKPDVIYLARPVLCESKGINRLPGN